MQLLNKWRSLYWRFYLRLRGAKIGENFQVMGPVDILLRDGADCSNINIGNEVMLTGKTYIRLRKNGKITIGNGVRIGTEVWLVSANDAALKVGDHSFLNNYSIFNGGHGITIGKYCIFAAFVYINSSEHYFRRGEYIQKQGFFGATVEIGDDVWLGGHVTVTKGVKIGDGAIVGANSVVVKNISPYKVVGGIPAIVIKDRQ